MELITIDTATDISANLRGKDNKPIKTQLRTHQVKDPSDATHVAICSSHSHSTSSLVVVAFIQASDVKTSVSDPQEMESACLLTLHAWYAKQLGLNGSVKSNNFVVLAVDKLITSKMGTLIEASVDGLGLAIWTTGFTSMVLPTEDLGVIEQISQHFNKTNDFTSTTDDRGITTNQVARKPNDLVDAFSQPEE